MTKVKTPTAKATTPAGKTAVAKRRRIQSPPTSSPVVSKRPVQAVLAVSTNSNIQSQPMASPSYRTGSRRESSSPAPTTAGVLTDAEKLVQFGQYCQQMELLKAENLRLHKDRGEFQKEREGAASKHML
jgi:hypothetical protein